MRRLLTIGAAVLALQPAPVSAEDWIATLQTAGRYVAVETRDSLAFFASGWGLEVFSIADPTNPVRLSSTPTLGSATDLEIDDRYAYVADQGHALLVYDCIDPTSPLLVAEDSLGLQEMAYPTIGDLLRVDTILYVALPYSDSGVYIFNIADPPNTDLASTFRCPCFPDTPLVESYDPKKFVRLDTLLYVFDYYGLWVANISDPGHPVAIGSYRLPPGPSGHWTPECVIGIGNRLIMYDGLFINHVDITIPALPALTTIQLPQDTSDTSFSAQAIRDLLVLDGHLILAAYASGLKVADIPADPADTLVIGPLFDTPGFAQAARRTDSSLVIADGDGGIQIVSGLPPAVDSAGYFASGSHIQSLKPFGPYLSALRRPKGGIYVIDADNPLSSSILDSVLTESDVRSYRLIGNRLYVTALGSDSLGFNTRLAVYDATDLFNPVMLGTYVSEFDSLGWRYGLGLNFAVSGTYTYHSDIVFSVIDVSRPDSMYRAGRVPGYFGGQGGEPLLGGRYAYVRYGSYAFVIDVTDPMAPDVLNPLGAPYIYSDAVLDDTILYASTNGVLQVISVADPLDFCEIGRWELFKAGSPIVKLGKVCFLGVAGQGIVAVDVSDPSAPVFRERFETPGYASGLLVDDSMLYVADGFGLTVIRHGLSTGIEVGDAWSLPRVVSLKQNYPNPFNNSTAIEFELVVAAPVTLEVYNLLGRFVSGRELGVLPPGAYRLSWIASDREGNDLPSGVYFYRITADDQTVTRKMLLLR